MWVYHAALHTWFILRCFLRCAGSRAPKRVPARWRILGEGVVHAGVAYGKGAEGRRGEVNGEEGGEVINGRMVNGGALGEAEPLLSFAIDLACVVAVEKQWPDLKGLAMQRAARAASSRAS